jgi:HSP20 family protein
MSNNPEFWRGSLFPTQYREVDRFFDDWLSRKDSAPQPLRPKCEVTEDKNQYLFKLDLPGLAKDQIKIEFSDQVLTLSGERKQERHEESKRQHLSEFSYGSFLRSFSIPGPVHSENITATYDHGVLQVSVPKSETSKTKQIQIR